MGDFKDMTARAAEISEKYRELDRKKLGKEWTPKDRAIGFVTDVGELMELVGAKEGIRAVDDLDARLGHELADCLWSIMTLARDYGVDLEAEFAKTMDKIEEKIAKEQSA